MSQTPPPRRPPSRSERLLRNTLVKDARSPKVAHNTHKRAQSHSLSPRDTASAEFTFGAFLFRSPFAQNNAPQPQSRTVSRACSRSPSPSLRLAAHTHGRQADPASPFSPKELALRSQLERVLSSAPQSSSHVQLARRASAGSRNRPSLDAPRPRYGALTDGRGPVLPQMELFIRGLDAEADAEGEGRWDGGVSDGGNEVRDESGHGVRIASINRAHVYGSASPMAASPTDAIFMRRHMQQQPRQQPYSNTTTPQPQLPPQSNISTMTLSSPTAQTTPRRRLTNDQNVPPLTPSRIPLPQTPNSKSPATFSPRVPGSRVVSAAPSPRAPQFSPFMPRGSARSPQVQALDRPSTPGSRQSPARQQSAPSAPLQTQAQTRARAHGRRQSTSAVAVASGLGGGAQFGMTYEPPRRRARSKSASTGTSERGAKVRRRMCGNEQEQGHGGDGDGQSARERRMMMMTPPPTPPLNRRAQQEAQAQSNPSTTGTLASPPSSSTLSTLISSSNSQPRTPVDQVIPLDSAGQSQSKHRSGVASPNGAGIGMGIGFGLIRALSGKRRTPSSATPTPATIHGNTSTIVNGPLKRPGTPLSVLAPAAPIVALADSPIGLDLDLGLGTTIEPTALRARSAPTTALLGLGLGSGDDGFHDTAEPDTNGTGGWKSADAAVAGCNPDFADSNAAHSPSRRMDPRTCPASPVAPVFPGGLGLGVGASPTKPFNVRRASAQCKEMQGYVSFGDVEGLGMPPREDGEGDEEGGDRDGDDEEGGEGRRGRGRTSARKGVLGWLGLLVFSALESKKQKEIV
ncbi:hypothetical protein HGRIS_000421 [Hohenbuehelia grisea]|uniref:Uncharacterized protein n=1 Tax=Hohenbuehelia grisea TaxID=104357 RepID=A0ABR3JRM4_9AGAR